ncbi:MAG: PKD domain-containing protein [Candidatus Thiodiazotropha sp. (ex Semelilucina semeliformis)]|nr:PKD domain-containing protein [Candidatus Thiodiazotropha sp. (ex Semelilucina semeliformis)]
MIECTSMFSYLTNRILYTCFLTGILVGCGGTNTDNPTSSVNQNPVATIVATPTSGMATLSVNANAGQSSDDGSIVNYQWDFGDGNTSQGPVTSHNYTQAGSYVLSLTVTDNEGASDTASTTIQVTNPPPPANQNPVATIAATPTSGPAALLVNVDASQSSDDGSIVNYLWNFGDGNTSQSVVTTHTYAQAGSYTLSLTVTDNEGVTNNTSTTIHVFNSLDNSQVIVPLGVTFYDDFQYNVARTNSSDPTGVNNPFTSQGGWSRVKSENITGSHNGYLYTVNQIPGYGGSFPGRNSTSVLAIEARPGSMGSQTDFYLQFGDENAPLNTVPGNVWFQFWMYSNRYDDPTSQNDQLSAYDGRFKFIYPCNGPYPCQQGQINWLNCMGYTTGEPFWANQVNTEVFMTNIDPYNTNVDYQLAPEWNQFKLGQTDVSENVTPNRWTLVKIHYDTSTTSGTFEAWMKPLGGQWVKVAEWINGQTPNFSWTIPAGDVGGHRVFRMPTTMDDHDSWMYIDDFAMATSEADLPVYPY